MVSGLCLLPFWIQLWGGMLFEDKVQVEWRWLIVALLLNLFYKWSFLYFLGATLGKLVMGLRVVPSSGQSEDLGLFQSFLRVFTDGLSFFFGLAPRALALLRLDRTHVSDWVAETRVVQLGPQRALISRHWVTALFVIVVSFSSQFSNLYQSLRYIEFANGQIIFDLVDLEF
jgi:uncharacterized RDD family membrane protein YckC